MQRSYVDLDILIRKDGPDYSAQIISSPHGAQASTTFSTPVTRDQIENLWLRISRRRAPARRIDAPEVEPAKTIGDSLYSALFKNAMLGCLTRSQAEAQRSGKGLRIRLRLSSCPEAANWPWEFMFDRETNSFLALSRKTPLVRFLDVPIPTTPLKVFGSLKVLAVIASPVDEDQLDSGKEWINLNAALEPLTKSNKISLTQLARPTFNALGEYLRNERCDILHFIGHGAYLMNREDGFLAFEDEVDRHAQLISGEWLGHMLGERDVRLAFLNACEGACSSPKDTFSGIAQSLIQKGLSAVIAMQSEITDTAAITFSRGFYTAIASGDPIDAAVSEARMSIMESQNYLEWATPVLFMRSADGQIFDVEWKSSDTALLKDISTAESLDDGRQLNIEVSNLAKVLDAEIEANRSEDVRDAANTAKLAEEQQTRIDDAVLVQLRLRDIDQKVLTEKKNAELGEKERIKRKNFQNDLNNMMHHQSVAAAPRNKKDIAKKKRGKVSTEIPIANKRALDKRLSEIELKHVNDLCENKTDAFSITIRRLCRDKD